MSIRNPVCLSALLLLAPAAVQAQDSDGDRVPDAIDVAPCDGQIASRIFVPGETAYRTLMFEDLWPSQGDFDFNDVVLAHQTTLELDGNGQLVRARLELDVLAVGADFDNGLALGLPLGQGSIASAQLVIDGGPAQALSPWASEQEAVFTLASSVRGLFGNANGYINTDPNLPTTEAVHLSIDIRLSAAQAIDTAAAPFDLFIFDLTRGVEVHRPEYRGSSRLAQNLLGTSDDGTGPSRAFVTKRGIPFALDLPQAVAYPQEGRPIDRLFPDIVTFGLSSGAQAQDFFRSRVNASESFAAAPANTPLTPRPNADRSCVPVAATCGGANGATSQVAPSTDLCGSGTPTVVTTLAEGFSWSCTGINGGTDVSCAAPRQRDAACGMADGGASLDAPTAGLCTVGAASAVASASNQWTWTCAGINGGANASCAATDWLCTPATSRSCPVANGAGTQTCEADGSAYRACQVASCDAGYEISGNQCAFIETYAWNVGSWGACSANPSWSTGSWGTCNAPAGTYSTGSWSACSANPSWSTGSWGTCDAPAGTYNTGSWSACSANPSWSTGSWGTCSASYSTGSWGACSANPSWSTGSWGSCSAPAGTYSAGSWGSCSANPSWSTGSWGSCSANPSWGPWSVCSASCGGGSQSRSCRNTGGTESRAVSCVNTSGTQTRNVSCTPGTGSQSRTVSCINTSGTQTRNVTCNSGSQSRSVSCVNTSGTQTRAVSCTHGTGLERRSVSCVNTSGTQTRNVSCVPGTGTRSRSVTCIGTSGQRTRTVTCRRERDGAVVADSFCAGPKPATSQACSGACSTTAPADTEACSATCTGSAPASSRSCTQNCSGSTPASARSCSRGCSGASPATSQSCTQSCSGPTPASTQSCGCSGSTPSSSRSCTQSCSGSQPSSSQSCTRTCSGSAPSTSQGCTESCSGSQPSTSRSCTESCTGASSQSCNTHSCPQPVNGQCGSNHGSFRQSLSAGTSGNCAAGSVSGFGYNSSLHRWTWTCAGANGGSNASCSATQYDCLPGSYSNGLVTVNCIYGRIGEVHAGGCRDRYRTSAILAENVCSCTSSGWRPVGNSCGGGGGGFNLP